MTGREWDPDEDPAVQAVVNALHHPHCDHHTGGPSACVSRALSAVGALRDAGLLAPSVTVDLDALPPGDNPEPWPWGDARRSASALDITTAVEAVARGMYEDSDSHYCDLRIAWEDYAAEDESMAMFYRAEGLRVVMTAAPLIERQVRDLIAAQIEQGPTSGAWSGDHITVPRSWAANVARRGETS